MCGIIACAGVRRASEILYKGLCDLEYRGYDSAGISVRREDGIVTVKRAGRVSAIECARRLGGDAGIGHTRWATHGAPTDANAHPHNFGGFSVVHNGIIENYAQLKAELAARGDEFLSQTDSEVVAHLLAKYYRGDLKEAVIRTVRRLKGAFALCILHEEFGGFAAVKYRSPVIAGYGSGCFAASDMPALSGLADRVAVLKDGQIAFAGENGFTFCDFDGNAVSLTFSPLPPQLRSGGKAGFPHYMIKEINEIPAAIRQTAAAFEAEGCARAFAKLRRKKFSQVIVCGCGTAYHAALAAAYGGEELLGVPVRAETAGEYRYRRRRKLSGTLFVAVSQSGETADTVEAARAAKAAGARVIAVTNVPYSALTSVADVVVPVRAGAEICVAATKSYCGQCAALGLTFCALAGGRHYGRAKRALAEAAAMCADAISGCAAEDAARACASASAVYFIGRGADYPSALEGSLKLKEVSYIPGEGYPAGELKHGPIALIDGGTLTVAVITDPALAEKTASAVEQVCARGGRAAVVCAEGCETAGLRGRAEYFIAIPRSELFPAIVAAVPLQLIAYRTAVILGRDPDKPRNLAKSVTVE